MIYPLFESISPGVVECLHDWRLVALSSGNLAINFLVHYFLVAVLLKEKPVCSLHMFQVPLAPNVRLIHIVSVLAESDDDLMLPFGLKPCEL